MGRSWAKVRSVLIGGILAEIEGRAMRLLLIIEFHSTIYLYE